MKQFLWKLAASFRYAFQGLFLLFRSERNMQLHLLAALVAIAAGLYTGLDVTRWLFLLLAIALVWIAEAFNTALERLSNKVSQEHHPLIKEAKDIGAAAVLLASIFALITGAIVFFL